MLHTSQDTAEGTAGKAPATVRTARGYHDALRATLDAHGLAHVPLAAGPAGPARDGGAGIMAPRTWARRMRDLPMDVPIVDGAILLDALALQGYALRPREQAWSVVVLRPDGAGGALVARAVLVINAGCRGKAGLASARIGRSLWASRQRPSAATAPDWIAIVVPSQDANGAIAMIAHSPDRDSRDPGTMSPRGGQEGSTS